MIEATLPTPPPKPARKRKPATPRAPRTIDPGIAAINTERNEKVKAYRSAQASAKILATILNKRLPKLTPNDRAALFDTLSKTETPTLPMNLEHGN